MKNLKSIYFLFLMLFLLSCERSDDNISIRIENVNNFPINSVSFIPAFCTSSSQVEYSYGNIAAQSISDYQIVSKADDSPKIKAEINGQTYIAVPNNCDSAKQLTVGKYNFRLFTIKDNNGNIQGIYYEYADERDE